MTNITVIKLSEKKTKKLQENDQFTCNKIMSHNNLYPKHYAKLIKLINFGIVTILLANTKALKFYRFDSVQNLISFID